MWKVCEAMEDSPTPEQILKMIEVNRVDKKLDFTLAEISSWLTANQFVDDAGNLRVSDEPPVDSEAQA
jgi:hypothetical protein